MGASIRLLGRPEARSGVGDPIDVRGVKTWAVLARIACADRPISRLQLADELFPEADDPLGSLRWALAQLRRLLGSSDVLTGDPVSLDPGGEVDIDVLALRSGRFEGDPEDLGPLLEGCVPRGVPDFESWLLIERERLAAMAAAHVRQAVLSSLSSGESARAVHLARHLTTQAPLDEGSHVLFVRSLVADGRSDAALAHVEAVERRFELELGVAPSAALRGAARSSVAAPPPGVSAESVVEALIESGRAGIDAGAVDAGMECLRRAVVEAERSDATRVGARAALELGTALVHTIRGHDDEGSIHLRRAFDLAESAGDSAVAASALRELAYVEALVGRRPTAADFVSRAEAAAGDDPALLAGIVSVDAFNRMEWGQVDLACERFSLAIDIARTADRRRQEAWALGLGARSHLLAGRLDAARTWAEASRDMVEGEQWLSFRPWPAAVIHELRLATGSDPVEVLAETERSFALSCQLGDPCWEGATARVMAIAYSELSDPDAALRWIADAGRRSVRFSDAYVGVVASILDTEATLAASAGDAARSESVARELLALAARTHQDRFIQIALNHLGGSVAP